MSRQAAAMQLLLILACSHTTAAFSGNRGFLALGAKMQPEVVAKTLAKVQDQWRMQVTQFLRCNATEGSSEEDCSGSAKAFGKSCSTVMSAVVEASSGDRAVVNEYMGDVCAEPFLKDWRQDSCEALSEQLTGAMTENSFDNRNTFNAEPVCASLFKRLTTEERARIAEEAELKEEVQKKALEEAAKMAEEEKRAAEKRAAEKAKSDTAKAPFTEHVIVFNAAANGTSSEAAAPQITESSAQKEEAPVNASTENKEAAAPQSIEGTPDQKNDPKEETVINATTENKDAIIAVNATGAHVEVASQTDSKEEAVVNATTDNKEEATVNATLDNREEAAVNATSDSKEEARVNATSDKEEGRVNATSDKKEEAPVTEHVVVLNAAVPANGTANEEATANATTDTKEEAVVNATGKRAEAAAPQSIGASDTKEEAIVNATKEESTAVSNATPIKSG